MNEDGGGYMIRAYASRHEVIFRRGHLSSITSLADKMIRLEGRVKK